VTATTSPLRKIGYGIDEFAAAADVGRDQVYKAIRSGKLKAVKWGRRTIIPAEEGERFIAQLPSLRLSPKA
jgi:excisionase family DNA binding protein